MVSSPAQGTLTSSVSRSFQLTVSQTFGTGSKLSEFLRAEINIQVIQTITATVDYTILIKSPDGRCWDYGSDGWGTTPPQRVSVHAPTSIEGWRIS